MRNTCTTCGGTGQISYFQGVSRFLLTWEECPHCLGTGVVTKELNDTGRSKNKAGKKESGAEKKKKR